MTVRNAFIWLEGMTRFRGLRHPDQWWERLGHCGPLHSLPQHRWDELARLKYWLWSRHVATLLADEQQECANGTHSSLRDDDPRNIAVLIDFRERMRNVDCIRAIDLALYHGDRMILDVELRAPLAPHAYRREIPGYFRGYEVKVHWPAEPNQS